MRDLGDWWELQRRWTSRGACCSVCQSKDMGPVLLNEVWARIGIDVRFLCEPCMETRLGRPLLAEELWCGPWNMLRNHALNKSYVMTEGI